jgi:signal recognition particle GTPase
MSEETDKPDVMRFRQLLEWYLRSTGRIKLPSAARKAIFEQGRAVGVRRAAVQIRILDSMSPDERRVALTSLTSDQRRRLAVRSNASMQDIQQLADEMTAFQESGLSHDEGGRARTSRSNN